jgi:hypothetical protein
MPQPADVEARAIARYKRRLGPQPVPITAALWAQAVTVEGRTYVVVGAEASRAGTPCATYTVMGDGRLHYLRHVPPGVHAAVRTVAAPSGRAQPRR